MALSTSPGVNGVNAALSGRQFMASSVASYKGPNRPQSAYDGEGPLPISGAVSNSATAAAAWRPPSGAVLPYSAATRQSTFQPYGA